MIADHFSKYLRVTLALVGLITAVSTLLIQVGAYKALIDNLESRVRALEAQQTLQESEITLLIEINKTLRSLQFGGD